jgi:hypothetical protein
VAAQLLTWFGTAGVMRYSLTFFGPLPFLVTAVLARVAQRGRVGEATALTLAGALVAFNLLTHVAFVRAGSSEPGRPVDAVIARMAALGLTSCYADSRISQVISFESAGHIVCADYLGLRDYGSLRAVDRVEAPDASPAERTGSGGPPPRAGAYRRRGRAERCRRLRRLPPLRVARSSHSAGRGSRLASARLVRWGARRPGVRPPRLDTLGGAEATR